MTMIVILNGKEVETGALLLSQLLDEQSLGQQKVATAVNGKFVASSLRNETALAEGDRIEIVSPRQGG